MQWQILIIIYVNILSNTTMIYINKYIIKYMLHTGMFLILNRISYFSHCRQQVERHNEKQLQLKNVFCDVGTITWWRASCQYGTKYLGLLSKNIRHPIGCHNERGNDSVFSTMISFQITVVHINISLCVYQIPLNCHKSQTFRILEKLGCQEEDYQCCPLDHLSSHVTVLCDG